MITVWGPKPGLISAGSLVQGEKEQHSFSSEGPTGVGLRKGLPQAQCCSNAALSPTHPNLPGHSGGRFSWPHPP